MYRWEGVNPRTDAVGRGINACMYIHCNIFGMHPHILLTMDLQVIRALVIFRNMFSIWPESCPAFPYHVLEIWSPVLIMPHKVSSYLPLKIKTMSSAWPWTCTPAFVSSLRNSNYADKNELKHWSDCNEPHHSLTNVPVSPYPTSFLEALESGKMKHSCQDIPLVGTGILVAGGKPPSSLKHP